MDNIRKFSFNASKALAESREDFQFHECWIDTNGKKMYTPVDVIDVRVIVAKVEQSEQESLPESYHLITKCSNEMTGIYTLEYIISKKHYLDFISEKNDVEFRLKLLQKYAKKDLFIRKNRARVHIDIRMNSKLYEEICTAANSCDMTPSAYLRDLAKGKRPRTALTQEESEIMRSFELVFKNYQNFFNAAKGIMKGMTAEEKFNFMIEGIPYKKWREFLIDGLPIMKRMINGSRMRQNIVWHDAHGQKLPKIGREVIVLVQPSGEESESLKVALGNRINSKEWNLPNIKYWLDVELPKGNNEEEE